MPMRAVHKLHVKTWKAQEKGKATLTFMHCCTLTCSALRILLHAWRLEPGLHQSGFVPWIWKPS